MYPVMWVFMEGRLIGRARLKIIRPDQPHIQARGALRLVSARAVGEGHRGQKRESKGNRRSEKSRLLHEVSPLDGCYVPLITWPRSIRDDCPWLMTLTLVTRRSTFARSPWRVLATGSGNVNEG